MVRLELAVQLAEKEADRLRVMLEEREGSHNQITAELEQQLRLWAQELGAECQHLHLLVEQSGAKQSSVQLPPRYKFLLWLAYTGVERTEYFVGNMVCLMVGAFLLCSPTVPEVLANLRTQREQLKHLIGHLHQELDSQKQTTEQLRKDKV